MEPPEPTELTDEDSAEEDAGGTADNLAASQLRAPAELQICVNDDMELDDQPEMAPEMQKIDPTDAIWVRGDLEEKIRQFPKPDYSAFSTSTPFELFELFFDQEVINFLVSESTRYALFKNMPDPQITPDEMKCFLVVLVLSGYNELPGKKYYWDSEPDMKNIMAVEMMRRDKFLTIFRYLHCADNLNIDKKDKMFKLRPLMDNLRGKFMTYFVLEPELNYDESMIKYYGKHSCKQFIRGKPIRFGYKAWCINTKNGYLVNFNIYQGNDPMTNENYQKLFGKAAAPFVTMINELPEQKRNLAYTFYFDNLFTGFTLLKYLKDQGYEACGTIRDNRIPKNCPVQNKKVMQKKPRGTYDSAIERNTGISLVRWSDNNIVTVASTNHGVAPLSSVKRFSRKEKKSIQVSRPSAIAKYNAAMGGTDLMDENVNRYRISIRGKKWWWCIFSWLIDVAIQNAWILYKKSGHSCTQLQFRRDIAKTVFAKYRNPPKTGGRPSSSLSSSSDSRVSDDVRYDTIGHLLTGTTNNKKIRCAGVNCNSIMRTTCSKCKVGLCIKCNIPFHTK